MKICFISREYPPETNWGGIGIYTHNMAHALVGHGNEVDVISLAVDSERDYFDGNVHVHRIKSKVSLPIGNDLARSNKVAEKLNKLGKFDIIEVPEWGAEGFISAFQHKAPLITRLHTPQYLIYKISGKPTTITAEWKNFLERTQTIRSTAITSPTRVLQEEVALSWHINTSRITVIPNGIKLEDIEQRGNAPNSINSDYIVYVGRLEARKGVHVLAKALPGVFERFPNLKMVFVGKDMRARIAKGTMKELILSINSKYIHNIIFTGFVTEESKFSLIRNSKLVVLPSLWENFPYTCLESMALGKAVIASKNCGFDEIIEDNSSGFLVEPGNCTALQNRIISCLETEDQVSRAEKNAKRKVKDFDIVKVSKDSIRYYEKILLARA